MTVEDVKEEVARIKECAYDDEKAHALEDALHENVLTAIGDGTAEKPGLMALEALKTQHIDFQRWCA